MSNSESMTATPMPGSVPKMGNTYDNPLGTPVLTLAVDEHNSRISSLVETVERLINRLAPVIDYPKPEPTGQASGGLCPPQSPSPKVYERIQSNTERLVRLERQLNDIHDRLTV